MMSDRARWFLCALLVLAILIVLAAIACESVTLILLARACR